MDNETRKNNIYIYGNVAPAYIPGTEENEAYKEALRERELRRRREEIFRERRRQRRILERQNKISRGNMVVMTMATALILGLCALYIGLTSQLNATMNNVAKLEGEVITLTAENDSTQKRIETSVDLNEIRKKATKELGMVYPKESQIEYYHVDNTDYMEQYKEIPSNKAKTVFGMVFHK